MYFNHEAGQIEMGRKEARDLNNFLQSINPNSGKTYWEDAKLTWHASKDAKDTTWEHYNDWMNMVQPNYEYLSGNRYTGKGKGYVSRRR